MMTLFLLFSFLQATPMSANASTKNFFFLAFDLEFLSEHKVAMNFSVSIELRKSFSTNVST